MALDNLPSLGSSTAVPGAAGLVTSVAGTAGNVTVTSTSTGASASTASDPLKAFNDIFKQLTANPFGPTDAQMQQAKDVAAASGDPIAQTENTVASWGNAMKWVQDNWPLLIMIGIVLLLAFYGLSAATRKS